MGSLREKKQTSTASGGGQEQENTRPTTSRGLEEYPKLTDFTPAEYDAMMANRIAMSARPLTRGRDDRVLIIQGAVHKISIHGQAYIPRIPNTRTARRVYGKIRAPTPYPHNEVAKNRRQEVAESSRLPRANLPGNLCNSLSSVTSTVTKHHKGVADEKKGWHGSYSGSSQRFYDEGRRPIIADASNHGKTTHGQNLRQSQVIGGPCSDRLICHTENTSTKTRHSMLQDESREMFKLIPCKQHRRDKSVSFIDPNLDRIDEDENRTQRPDLFERRHGVSLESFVLPKAGIQTNRRQLARLGVQLMERGFTSASFMARGNFLLTRRVFKKGSATTRFGVGRAPSPGVDGLLEQLGWCHGDEHQRQGWTSPQQQQQQPEQSGQATGPQLLVDNSCVKQEPVDHSVSQQSEQCQTNGRCVGGENNAPSNSNKEDMEGSDKKDVADFRVKIRQLWQKLFN